MADDVDRATENRLAYESFLQESHRNRPKGRGPEYIDGEACCRQCGDVIPENRLRALPDTELCIECADEMQQKLKNTQDQQTWVIL